MGGLCFLYILSSIDGHSGCFCLSAVVNSEATFILLIFIYLALPSLSCGPWDLDLVPDQGSNSGPTALGVQSLSRWTTREVLRLLKKKFMYS